MATCIFIHSLIIMHLIVLLLKIKQLKEETSVIKKIKKSIDKTVLTNV